jgi:hypothetical protein
MVGCGRHDAVADVVGSPALGRGLRRGQEADRRKMLEGQVPVYGVDVKLDKDGRWRFDEQWA